MVIKHRRATFDGNGKMSFLLCSHDGDSINPIWTMLTWNHQNLAFILIKVTNRPFLTRFRTWLILFQDRNWFVNAGCDLQQSFVCKANFAPPQSRPRDDRGDYGPCPGDWQTSGSDGTGHYCLKAFSQEKSWFEADAICKANFGARLTSIHDNYFNDRVSFQQSP